MMPRGHDRIADAPDTGVTSATLLGRAHRLSGQVAVADAGGRAAVGLARGWMPKPYAYVDPNEDVVACSVADHGHLLIVADGHNGHRASHVAVAEVMDTFADAVPEHFDQDTVLDVSEAVERRIAAANAADGPRSRTTMVVALRTATQLWWFAAGDSALTIVSARRTGPLPAATRWFFGDGLDRGALARSLASGRIAVPDGAWVVLATDGYTDYLPDHLTVSSATAVAVAGVDEPADAAHALLDQARRGGAGDNVGVAVSAAW
ncbi:MAG TPA: protein phosphatase 2C domain-containing protein [Euzebyales bacterium]